MTTAQNWTDEAKSEAAAMRKAMASGNAFRAKLHQLFAIGYYTAAWNVRHGFEPMSGQDELNARLRVMLGEG